jgi:hypothetical protein
MANGQASAICLIPSKILLTYGPVAARGSAQLLNLVRLLYSVLVSAVSGSQLVLL